MVVDLFGDTFLFRLFFFSCVWFSVCAKEQPKLESSLSSPSSSWSSSSPNQIEENRTNRTSANEHKPSSEQYPTSFRSPPPPPSTSSSASSSYSSPTGTILAVARPARFVCVCCVRSARTKHEQKITDPKRTMSVRENVSHLVRHFDGPPHHPGALICANNTVRKAACTNLHRNS